LTVSEKRIVVVTPPGMKGGDDMNEEQYNVALMLEQHLKEDWGFNNFITISVGDLLQKEITKKSDYGKKIFESRKHYEYVDDDIVIDLVRKHIEECEKELSADPESTSNHGWILEGFPRTRRQAQALQKMKIFPDRLFLLNIANNTAFENLRLKLS
jgi:adenylate kinase